MKAIDSVTAWWAAASQGKRYAALTAVGLAVGFIIGVVVAS